ncbi:hypothetical protein BJF92_12490 [Rhizobium rhizosphaerae]|uniref:Uncharacterized protein n=2 Tax=Xaviernesmea rhizosphaerae TaxID=1672749 RepID=A0A1Q9ANG6_9HYPH|nr:hypothetical protein BJF92_12490 [Xaviernesmea rhizosphaerae]
MRMTRLSFPASSDLAERIKRVAALQNVTVASLLCEMSERMVEEFEAFEKFRQSAQRGLVDAGDDRSQSGSATTPPVTGALTPVVPG